MNESLGFKILEVIVVRSQYLESPSIFMWISQKKILDLGYPWGVESPCDHVGMHLVSWDIS